ERICLKALAKPSAERYASMAEFATALTDYLRNGRSASGKAVPAGAPLPTMRPASGAAPSADEDSQLRLYYAEPAAQFYSEVAGRPNGVRRPARWPWIAATILLVGAVIAIAVLALRRQPTVVTPQTVVVHLHLNAIDLKDPEAIRGMVFILDGKEIDREK